MAEGRIGQAPFFDRGIDDVVVQQGPRPAGLPEASNLLPAEDLNTPQLDRLLDAPSFDRLLDAALRPHVGDRSLLLPVRFNAALKAALDEIQRQAARRMPPSSREAKLLRRAQRLLGEEDELRELARMYTSALFQG